MSTKVINDPSALGWEQDGATANGTPIYKWAEGADNEHPIVDGDTEGQVTTWDGAKWTPDSSLTIDAAGNAMSSSAFMVQPDSTRKTEVGGGAIELATDVGPYVDMKVDPSHDYKWRMQYAVNDSSRQDALGFYYSADGISAGSAKFWVMPDGNATFSGAVTANAFVGDGSGLTGVGGGGDNPQGLGHGDVWADRGSNQGYVYYGSASVYMGYNGSRFDFNGGDVYATDFIATSDERLKDNITTAPVGLIDSLKGREWDWKESGEKGSGVVAQELEQVLPHLVHTDDDGMKSVSYMGLCAYLIEEVKLLRAEVEALK